MHVDDPSSAAYSPSSQSMQALTFDVVEYLPVAHAVHLVAPAADPVFVMDPALQLVHEASLGSIEYVPAAHAVHVVVFVLLNVFVTDRAEESKEVVCATVL